MPDLPIDVFSWPTPNGHKVHMNIGAGDQFAPVFLAISPNNKIRAITDPAGPDGAPSSLFAFE